LTSLKTLLLPRNLLLLQKAPQKPETRQRKNIRPQVYDALSKEDTYIRGPSPVLTGTLSNGLERLHVAVHFHDSGVSRVRITEEGLVRWTSDDVVLNVDEMNMASSVEYLEGESLKEFVGDGYVGNYRGVKSGEVTLLLKVAPFEMSLLVKGESVMSLNTNQMMHFEKKRDPTTKEKRKLTVKENEKPKKLEKDSLQEHKTYCRFILF